MTPRFKQEPFKKFGIEEWPTEKHRLRSLELAAKNRGDHEAIRWGPVRIGSFGRATMSGTFLFSNFVVAGPFSKLIVKNALWSLSIVDRNLDKRTNCPKSDSCCQDCRDFVGADLSVGWARTRSSTGSTGSGIAHPSNFAT